MSGKVFLPLLSFLLIYSFKKYSPGYPPEQKILAVYLKADRLFNKPNSTEINDSLCMMAFRQVIRSLSTIPAGRFADSLLYEANYKLGILSDIHLKYAQATSAYLNALHHTSRSQKKFRMQVLAGAGFYNMNNFDSASYYLSQAEEGDYSGVSFEDRVRLYNTLGVLYYDNGNYLQSKNYFQQALHQITVKNPADDFAFSLQLNIATCYYKLGMFRQALDIYRRLKGSALFQDPLFMNMGRAYAGIHAYDSALLSFKKVRIKVVPGVLNEMARTCLESGKPEQAAGLLKQYQTCKKAFHLNPLDDGVNALYFGDLFLYRHQPEQALASFQTAMTVFSGSFSERDVRKNPGSFTGSFAYYRLFELLEKKAAAWEMMYKKTSRAGDLQSAYDTYQTAISLLSYIEKSYEMDDAKLLLKQKSGELYSNAMKTCLLLSRIYPDKNFIEEAFLISEKNKASVMNAQLRERNFLRATAYDTALSSEEKNIRFNIARLNTRADERMDSTGLQKINEEKSSYETRLVSVRKKMDGNSRFYQVKYADDFPTIRQLQDNMKADQALISFFNEPGQIDIFVLTQSSLRHVQLDSGQMIRQNIQQWIQILQSAESGKHSRSTLLKQNLYRQFMKPILKLAADKKEWIVVPDGLFFQLPVESLYADEKGNLVIENHAVSYEFSARFMMENSRYLISRLLEKPVLAFAPFSLNGLDLQSEGMGWMEKLPYSADEIAGLKGSRYLDQQGTKQEFLKNLNRYPIVHLATHAITDLENPSASYIAFYPSVGERSADFLFLDEIYSLRMDSCQLMIISACETGRGELVRREGVLSFARAFMYSGCPSTINTLWKADDRSTSEILKSFYVYLESGDSKSIALQKAKLDYIYNNPVNRNPAYWSHIVLTGDPGALYKKKQPWLWVVLAMSCGTIFILTIRKRKIKKSRLFS